jgi:hypothetical protein
MRTRAHILRQRAFASTRHECDAMMAINNPFLHYDSRNIIFRQLLGGIKKSLRHTTIDQMLRQYARYIFVLTRYHSVKIRMSEHLKWLFPE